MRCTGASPPWTLGGFRPRPVRAKCLERVPGLVPVFAVLLSGEHATLPGAELRGLLAVHDPGATIEVQGTVAVVKPANEAASRQAIQRMALGHEWGTLWANAPDAVANVRTAVEAVQRHASGKGRAAVVAQRRAGPRGIGRTDVERALGQALQEAGHAIDLAAPEHVVFAWLADGNLWVGLRGGLLDRSTHEKRVSDERAHFSPVSLHPRRAAGLLHLARVPPGGRILDPFCGTGTFVLEAALEGYDAWGSDLDAFMVQGTLQTLADAGPQPLEGTVFEADVAAVPNLVGAVDGIVTDFPYGRASSSHDEELAALYDRAFAAFAKLLPAGRFAVVGCAQPELLPDLARHGFRETEHHVERVHRSLTRHYVVVQRAGQAT